MPTSSQQAAPMSSAGMASNLKSDEPVIGIVVGRTNCSVGIFWKKKIQLIANDKNERVTPAVVAFTEERCLIGQEAKDQASSNIRNTIPVINKLLGRKYEEIAKAIPNMPFKVVINENGSTPMIEVECKGDVRLFSAEGIMGLLLTKMKDTAQEFAGRKVTKAVICMQPCPKEAAPFSLMSKMKGLADSLLSAKDSGSASMDVPEVIAMRNAAALAGLQAVEVIEKPIAAVYAYGLQTEKKNVIVFHCGGETTVATVLSISESGMKIKGCVQNTSLGGNDFDDRLVTHCRQMFKLKNIFEIPTKNKAMGDLKKAVADAKAVLSNAQQASIQLPMLYRGKDFSVKILRSQFEEWCGDLLYNATVLIDDAMNGARITKEDVSGVIMIGGSCKIPKIEELVISKFGPEKILRSDEVPPELIATHGTVVRSAILNGENKIPKLIRKAVKGNAAAAKKQPVPRPRGANNPAVKQMNPVLPKQERVEDMRQGRHVPQAGPSRAPAPVVVDDPVEEVLVQEPDSGIVMGIDLGTTYSCVGIWKHGAVQIIPDAYDRRIIPSCVAFTDVNRLMGYEAKLHAAIDPENVVFEAKRMIGRKFNDPEVQKDMVLWPFKVVDDNSKPKIEVTYMQKKQQFHAEDISAFVLSRLKSMAEEYTNQKISKAVITVPAYFNDFQRVATKKAAQIAGLEVLKIINEPTAAAIAYSLDYMEAGNRTILVYDLGGGTFDVSILLIDGNDLQVKATAGDTHLGGEDFDNRLVSHFAAKFMVKHNEDIRADKRVIRRLRVACEKAKVSLSEEEEAEIDLPHLFKGIHYKDKMTRAVFENMCQELFDKTIVLLEKVLTDAKMAKGAIDDVVLVGGSTRIPKIQEMVKAFFNGKELKRDINPDEAVAYGAVMQSALMEENYDIAPLPIHKIRDVTPLSLGIGTMGEVMQAIIPRNTRIPVQKEATFYTEGDNQEYAYFDVLQGERPSVKDNVRLGEMIISGIPPARRSQASVSVVFSLDQDGVLLAKARTSPDAPFQTIKINDPCDISAEEVERMVSNAAEMQANDMRERQRVAVRNELHQVCYDHRNDALMGALCQETLLWLQRNPNARHDILVDKLNRVRL